MTYLGLLLIAIAWFIQLYFVWKGKKEINALFVIVYAVGVALIAINSFMMGFNVTALLNLADFVPAVLILWKIKSMSVTA